MKVKQALKWGEKALSDAVVFLGHGFDNEWDEALALLLYVLGLGWDSGEELLERELSQSEISRYKALVQKRSAEKVPVAYLVNESWFAGIPFYVNQKVLIPRSPLAELIEDHFSVWFDQPPSSILDLCTGSGCIALACALHMPDSSVDASDLSEEALEVAKTNIEKYELQARVNLFKSDLFEQIPHRKYQLIVSNPPYVDAQDMSNLPEEYLHEPAMALQAGEDGLLLVDRILASATQYLSDDGLLIVELGNSQEAFMEKHSGLSCTWLEFERGGYGVFAVDHQSLNAYMQDAGTLSQ